MLAWAKVNDPISKKKNLKSKRARGVALVVELLPSEHKALKNQTPEWQNKTKKTPNNS
jgi:hypothetical protein